jgi:hypothetical protein
VAKVGVDGLGLCAKCFAILEAAPNDGFGKEKEVLERSGGVLYVVRQGIIEDAAISSKHARSGVIKSRDFGDQVKAFNGVYFVRWSAMEVFVALQPKGMYGSPKFRGKFLKET